MARDLSLFSFPSMRFPSMWDDDLMMSPRTSNGLDVYETEKEVVVEAAIAGVQPDDVDITFEKGVLTLSGQARTEDKDSKKKYYYQSSRSFSYQVALPVEVDQNEEPEAHAENGVMKVVFQKAKASMPKKISIKKSK